MALSREPFDDAPAPDSEFESANAGWDPYVASLIGEQFEQKSAKTSDDSAAEKTSAPVMTITRRIADALRKKKS